QCDKDRYAKTMSSWVKNLRSCKIIQAEASEILYEGKSDFRTVFGVRLKDGSILKSRLVLVTSGTFMRALMFCGSERSTGGRFGDKASDFLSTSIEEAGHNLKRLKTGTPARL